MTRQLMTVEGPRPPDSEEIDWFLPHERVLHRLGERMLSVGSVPGVAPEPDCGPITPEQHHILRVAPWSMHGENLMFEKEDEVFRELESLSKSVTGHGIVLDTTTSEEGRSADQLRRLSKRLPQVDIVAATSFQPSEIRSLSADLSFEQKAERIAKFLETELLFGITDSSEEVRAGVIYQQVDAALAMTTEDDLLARGLALAQANTRAPIFLSFSYASTNDAILGWVSRLEAHGASMECVVVCHADRWCDSDSGEVLLRELGHRRMLVSFDWIGLYTISDVALVNPCHSIGHVEPPNDRAIARCILKLVHQHNMEHQIMISSGVTQRLQFQRYGGGGFSHALLHFRRRLMTQEQPGLSPSQWRIITRETPMRLLAWYTPPEAAPIPKHFLLCSICATPFEPIVGEYFTKFSFIYCGTKCLRKHSKMGFKPLA
ncbi:hypothetical protein PINS_up009953 [Pythium insidiosum]|nr:hypothetical protein PINS_up009953 [Pythium insidiosum]